MTEGPEPHALALVSLLVREYDEAIAWFRRCLGFRLAEDTALGEGRRWVVMRPGEGDGAGLLIARAVGARQEAAVGNQCGGRVGFFLHTSDFRRDRASMEAAGVDFREPTRREPYGTIAVFVDLYGNPWDLIEPAAPAA